MYAAINESPFRAFDGVLPALFGLLTSLVRVAGGMLTVDLTLDTGVTCTGVNSLFVLPILCFVTAIIVLIFDSAVFTVLAVAPSEYQHHVSHQLHRFGISARYARWCESYVVLGLFFAVESMTKNVVEVTIATMLVGKFIPYWKDRTEACETDFRSGGVPHSEFISSSIASAVFYFLSPFVIHMLLNTFIWGLAPSGFSKTPKRLGFSKASKRVSFLARGAPNSYRAKQNDNDNYFKMFGRTITGVDIANALSPLGWLALSSRDDGLHSEDLILHDPRFWQRPSLWWLQFKMDNDDSSCRAFVAYLSAMSWKFKMLLKLTCGVWSEGQLENFQISHRVNVVNMSDELTEEHEAMLRAVGQQQSSVW